MSSEHPSAPESRHTAEAVSGTPLRAPGAVADRQPVRLPDWFRDAQTPKPLGRRDRIRLWLADHGFGSIVTIGITLAVAMLAGVGLITWQITELPRMAQPEPTVTVTPTSAVGYGGRKVDYFAGTPAASYPQGAAGIVLPSARAEGPFTVTQVRDALAAVRQALVEGRLDGSMAAGIIDPFVALFAPDAQPEIRSDFTSDIFLNYATRITTGADRARDAPRVKGRITYRATRDTIGAQVLEITTNFTWVYAFAVAEPAGGAGLVAVRDEVVWHISHPADVTAASRGLWLVSARAVLSNVDCAKLHEGFLDVAHPLDRNRDRDAQAAETEALFDPERPLPAVERC